MLQTLSPENFETFERPLRSHGHWKLRKDFRKTIESFKKNKRSPKKSRNIITNAVCQKITEKKSVTWIYKGFSKAQNSNDQHTTQNQKTLEQKWWRTIERLKIEVQLAYEGSSSASKGHSEVSLGLWAGRRNALDKNCPVKFPKRQSLYGVVSL